MAENSRNDGRTDSSKRKNRNERTLKIINFILGEWLWLHFGDFPLFEVFVRARSYLVAMQRNLQLARNSTRNEEGAVAPFLCSLDFPCYFKRVALQLASARTLRNFTSQLSAIHKCYDVARDRAFWLETRIRIRNNIGR